LVEFGGTRENNIVLSGERSRNFTPFKDANPHCQEDAKYKGFGGTADLGLYAFQSPDGIKWKQFGDEPVITEGALDSQNLAFWDTIRSAVAFEI
jgi:hypothetical protein